jgi:hypothetical protein
MAVPRAHGYKRSVFINCPFDQTFKPLLNAIIFAIHDCGFQVRIALEDVGSGQARIDKIVKLISESQYAICDLSRIDKPRLNMAFETGLVLGAKYFGGTKHKTKDLLVLDRVEHRYKKTLSDLGGADGGIHHNSPAEAIGCVRLFLARKSRDPNIPGRDFIVRRFKTFKKHLKVMTAGPNARFNARELDDVKYIPELINTIVTWQEIVDKVSSPR